MRRLVVLPVLSADALSSNADGPQAMLAVLVLAGLPGLSYSPPVGAEIAFLMLAVGISYRQTIRAYPQGGGSFIVASENSAASAPWPPTGPLPLDPARATAGPHTDRPVPELVDRHWWAPHPVEHVAERLQPVLHPGVVWRRDSAPQGASRGG